MPIRAKKCVEEEGRKGKQKAKKIKAKNDFMVVKQRPSFVRHAIATNAPTTPPAIFTSTNSPFHNFIPTYLNLTTLPVRENAGSSTKIQF